MLAATESLNKITTLIDDIGIETRKQTEQMETVFSPSSATATKKNLINEFAKFLKSKANEIQQSAVIGRQNYETFADEFILAASMQRETADPETYASEIAQFLAEAEKSLSLIPTNRMSIASFKEAVAALPKITIQINQAKKQLIGALDDCIKLFDEVERKIYDISART